MVKNKGHVTSKWRDISEFTGICVTIFMTAYLDWGVVQRCYLDTSVLVISNTAKVAVTLVFLLAALVAAGDGQTFPSQDTWVLQIHFITRQHISLVSYVLIKVIGVCTVSQMLKFWYVLSEWASGSPSWTRISSRWPPATQTSRGSLSYRHVSYLNN